MIAFGCSINSDPDYRQGAKLGLERATEPDSRWFVYSTARTVPATHNLMLERAAALSELEALVLVHEDAEIVDRAFTGKLRRAFADEEVAIVGCVGATGAQSIAWWDGSLSWTSARYRYEELGGGELLWPQDGPQVERRPGPVDAVYGVLLALSPWAVQNLRFDESLGSYGHDFDLCAQARAAGRKVLAVDLEIVHHHSLEILTGEEAFASAHIRAAEKWDPAERSETEWRARARAAEADAGAARLMAASTLLQVDATERFFESRLDEIRATRSWRWTEPLRRGNAIARRARARITAPDREPSPG